MKSIVNKQSFLLSLIARISKNDNEAQEELNRFFMEVTNGKVYKYRSFDAEGHSLDNLKNGTLYCSPPSAFNDPFECKLGLDIQTMMAAKSGIEIGDIGTIFEHFICVYNGKAGITDYAAAEQSVIRKWLNSEALDLLLKNAQNSENEEQLLKILSQNTDWIIDLLQGATEDTQISQALHGSRKTLNAVLKDRLTQISLDSPLLPLELNKIYGTSYDADEISTAALINDKYHPEKHGDTVRMQNTFSEIEMQLKDKLENLFWVGCLAEDYKNRLMWSHYADSHKGFCVEYDFSLSDLASIVPLPVCYSDDRVMMPWDAVFRKNDENIQKASEQMMLALLTKDTIWEYENEWRILIPQSAGRNLKMPPITCIYIGAMCEETNKRKLIEIAAELDIPVKQMVIDRGKYLLHVADIEQITE